MLSWPPAMMTVASPLAICCWPSATARRPEPHTWLRLQAVFSLGTPPFIAACRAGFWPWPAVSTWPKITSSTSPPWIPARSMTPLITAAPRSCAGVLAKGAVEGADRRAAGGDDDDILFHARVSPDRRARSPGGIGAAARDLRRGRRVPDARPASPGFSPCFDTTSQIGSRRRRGNPSLVGSGRGADSPCHQPGLGPGLGPGPAPDDGVRRGGNLFSPACQKALRRGSRVRRATGGEAGGAHADTPP